MAYEQRDGRFSLFKNEAHEPGDQKPTMKGRGMWRGELIEFAVWTKERAGGEKYFSGKMQEPLVKTQPGAASATPVTDAGKRGDMDDEIPF